MEKGKRGRLVLQLKRVNNRLVKQGLYERDIWDYYFESESGVRYFYSGKIYALFINKWYEITATSDGFRYGAWNIKRIKPKPAGDIRHDLFVGN